jgi:hypothetical protein
LFTKKVFDLFKKKKKKNFDILDLK